MYQCIYIEQITIRGPSYSAETNKECHYSSFFSIDQPIYKPISSMISNKLQYNSEQCTQCSNNNESNRSNKSISIA